jgi:transposase
MKVRFETDIRESEEELKKMFLRENDGRIKERIHIIYLLKTGNCKNIKDLTLKIPRDRNTISGWIKKYKTGGIELLCKRETSPGRTSVLTDDEKNIIKEKLCNTEGFGSYNEIYEFVEKEIGKKINKKTLYHICHYELKGVSKVPRPYNPKRNDESIRIFKENFHDDIKKEKSEKKRYRKVRIFVQDESRFGLISICRRRIVMKGVRAICKKQYDYKSLWLFGVAEPLTGESFFTEFPKLNRENFQIFINRFSEKHKHCLNIIIADRSRCHTSQYIEFPDNIVMKFIPPYSPELNPSERLWKSMKDKLAENNIIYDSLEALRNKIFEVIKYMSNKVVKNLTFSSYIKEYFDNA